MIILGLVLAVVGWLLAIHLLFLIGAAATGGGAFTMSGDGWLLPGGLAAWCLAWLVTIL